MKALIITIVVVVIASAVVGALGYFGFLGSNFIKPGKCTTTVANEGTGTATQPVVDVEGSYKNGKCMI